MKDLIGEKVAIDQTNAIVKRNDLKGISYGVQKKIVRKIYENQLKRFTAYNRSQRNILVKELFKKKAKKS